MNISTVKEIRQMPGDNIGYPPAGITAREMISLYLKKAT
jgi:hypothetical protein